MAIGDYGDTDSTPLYGTDPDEMRKRLFPGLFQPPAATPPWLPATPPSAPQPAQPDIAQTALLPRPAINANAAPVAPIAPDVQPPNQPAPSLSKVIPTPASGPNLQQDELNGQVARPQQSDYKPEDQSRGRRIAEAIAAGMVGFKNPQAGVELGERLAGQPRVAAQQAFQADEETFDKNFNHGLQSQQAGREAENTASEIKYRDAQTAQLANPQPKPKEEEWSIVPGVTGPKGEPVQQEKNSGQVRVAPLPGATLKQTNEKPDTANQDKERYEEIIAARTQGQQVKPADAAWAKAYEKASTLGPAMNIAAMDERGKAFGRNRPVEVLDTWNGNRPIRVSAGEQEDNPDRYINQSGGQQALGKQVTADDIQGALENVKKTVGVLDNGLIHRAEVAAALADPKSTKEAFLESGAANALSPPEREYVISVLTAREVVGGLRNLLGTGSATDSRINAMIATLPGPKTPDSKYATAQIDSALATLKRVRPAIPNVAPKNNPNAPPPASSGGSTAPPKTAEEYLKKFQ
jgi:hypothetical protein